MKKTLLALLCAAQLFASDVQKVIYDLSTSELETIENRFIKGIVANKNHYENQLQELDVRVIIHGGAYKFFVNDLSKTVFKEDKEAQKINNELKARLKSLATTYGVKFQMCQVGANSKKLTREDIASYVEMAPNTTIALINAQNDGYAYVPVR
ncbi:MAG: DsrE family protein [Helicobacteraceae bacterium]|nr:DsrE family protein [Helicobacteraceae bacterium]